MKAARTSGLLVLAVACHAAPTSRPTSPASTQLAADIDTLAGRAFQGREAGTAGGDSAADFIARRYQYLGARAAFTGECESADGCSRSYEQRFQIASGVCHNVAAIVDGLDPARRNEFIVVGAHFDHLGTSPTWALDRNAGFVIRPGADDNASGTAAVLELTRRFARRAAKRSILFVNFDAEEQGLVGSRTLVRAPPVPMAAVSFMVNLDMIGRLRGDQIFIETRRVAPSVRALVDSIVRLASLRARYDRGEFESDDASFAEEGVPTLGFSTGRHDDYHTARDTPARLDMEGIARIVDLAEVVVRRLADR